MKRFFAIGLILMSSVFTLHAQYVSKVIEYVPAPGQFINKPPGLPENAESIVGGINGLVSLGAFGGYIICQFNSPVENHPDNPYGVDFTIFGNAYNGSSEPGIVMVMKDENENGAPDDQWFELKGSHHYFSSTKAKYAVTYKNPGKHADVKWIDNEGQQGVLPTNNVQLQNYYPESDNFPNIPSDQYTLKGTLLSPQTYQGLLWFNHRFDFGYADNTPKVASGSITEPDNPYTLKEIEGGGGDAFDINWAVDSTGNPIHLNEINFIKIYNGVLKNAGAIGEISPEIRGIVDVAPNSALVGISDVIISNHPNFNAFAPNDDEYILPQHSQFQFESMVLSKGMPNSNQQLNWHSSNSNILSVDPDGKATAHQPGTAEITVDWQKNTSINRKFKIKVTEATHLKINKTQLLVFPNPASNYLYIRGELASSSMEIFSSKGKLMLKNITPTNTINISTLPQGLYLLKLKNNGQEINFRFIKR